MKTTTTGTEYIAGVFTPLDPSEIQETMRTLWGMFLRTESDEAATLKALSLYRSAIDRCGVETFCAMVRSSSEIEAMKQLMRRFPDIHSAIKALKN